MDFSNKTALVTGAAVGIGRATALELGRMGASLVLIDVDAQKLETVKKELSEFTDKVWTYVCDFSPQHRTI